MEGATESRLDANFTILSVDSGLVAGGFRLRIRNAATGKELSVSVPEGTLSSEQTQVLQDGEWGKKAVQMQLNLRKIGDRVTSATLIEAGLTAGECPRSFQLTLNRVSNRLLMSIFCSKTKCR